MNEQLIVRRIPQSNDYYFVLIKSNKKDKRDRPLIDYLTFNKEDYWVYKSTGKQKEVTYEEMLEFNYSAYFFIKKTKDKDEINKWIDFLYTFTSIPYLNRPFPPIEVMNKIKIKK